MTAERARGRLAPGRRPWVGGCQTGCWVCGVRQVGPPGGSFRLAAGESRLPQPELHPVPARAWLWARGPRPRHAQLATTFDEQQHAPEEAIVTFARLCARDETRRGAGILAPAGAPRALWTRDGKSHDNSSSSPLGSPPATATLTLQAKAADDARYAPRNGCVGAAVERLVRRLRRLTPHVAPLPRVVGADAPRRRRRLSAPRQRPQDGPRACPQPRPVAAQVGKRPR